MADREFQRHEMMDVASVIPDEYIWDCSAIGTVDECVTNLRRYIDAGPTRSSPTVPHPPRTPNLSPHGVPGHADDRSPGSQRHTHVVRCCSRRI